MATCRSTLIRYIHKLSLKVTSNSKLLLVEFLTVKCIIFYQTTLKMACNAREQIEPWLSYLPNSIFSSLLSVHCYSCCKLTTSLSIPHCLNCQITVSVNFNQMLISCSSYSWPDSNWWFWCWEKSLCSCDCVCHDFSVCVCDAKLAQYLKIGLVATFNT